MQFDTDALLPPGGGAQRQHTVPSRSTYLEAPAATAKLGFLQRRVAQKIPFTTSKLADILDLFHIPPRTSSNTLGLCDAWGHFFSSLRFSVGLSSRDPGPTL